MEQPQDIRLSFSLSLPEQLRLAAVMMFQRKLFLIFGLGWPVIGVVLAIFALMSGLPAGAPMWRLVGFCFVFMPVLLAISAFGALAVARPMREPLDYVFDHAGIHVSTSAFQHTHGWNQIGRFKRVGGFLLFFFSPRHAHAIPLRALPGPQVEAALAAMAQAHGVGTHPH
ncbi:YcxB family protein [Lysobacter sp. K5869]|uniref:YcxB family protein n=1 Tax=Lysobacter sp. K5869 TaxID=2820808 RepID=UPI001C063531|nr:YcxB family protein [Lysobacter sp. K5869]QWP78327.1 YcxB family protein [Lysobacter sp. K5869]